MDQIIIFEDQDSGHEVDVRFEDKTGFCIRLESRLVIESGRASRLERRKGALIRKFI